MINKKQHHLHQVLHILCQTTDRTVLSEDPDTAYCPSVVRATEKTSRVWPSNVFRTPVLVRSQLFRVLSQEDETMQRSTWLLGLPSTTSRFLMVVTATEETAARWPFIVSRRGPPGRFCSGCTGVRRHSGSFKASERMRSRIGLKFVVYYYLPCTDCKSSLHYCARTCSCFPFPGMAGVCRRAVLAAERDQRSELGWTG